MTLQSSGQISISDVNLELGYASTRNTNLNEFEVRALFGKPSGLISLLDGYGKNLIGSASYTWTGAATIFGQNTQEYIFNVPFYKGLYVEIRGGGGGGGNGSNVAFDGTNRRNGASSYGTELNWNGGINGTGIILSATGGNGGSGTAGASSGSNGNGFGGSGITGVTAVSGGGGVGGNGGIGSFWSGSRGGNGGFASKTFIRGETKSPEPYSTLRVRIGGPGPNSAAFQTQPAGTVVGQDGSPGFPGVYFYWY
jgi:hypothetical protein